MLDTEVKTVENATCTFCGCVCDDMILTVEGNRITKAKNACVLGNAWFLNHHAEERPVCMIEGRPTKFSVQRAIQSFTD
jgi:formylmethanofuran dehydrogenase subunit B